MGRLRTSALRRASPQPSRTEKKSNMRQEMRWAGRGRCASSQHAQYRGCELHAVTSKDTDDRWHIATRIMGFLCVSHFQNCVLFLCTRFIQRICLPACNRFLFLDTRSERQLHEGFLEGAAQLPVRNVTRAVFGAALTASPALLDPVPSPAAAMAGGAGVDHIFKVLLIGDAGVGKSSLLLRHTRRDAAPNTRTHARTHMRAHRGERPLTHTREGIPTTHSRSRWPRRLASTSRWRKTRRIT